MIHMKMENMNTSMDNTKIMADKFEIIEEHRYAYLFATPPYLGITNHRVFLQVNACGNQQPRTMVIGCNRPHGLNPTFNTQNDLKFG